MYKNKAELPKPYSEKEDLEIDPFTGKYMSKQDSMMIRHLKKMNQAHSVTEILTVVDSIEKKK